MPRRHVCGLVIKLVVRVYDVGF